MVYEEMVRMASENMLEEPVELGDYEELVVPVMWVVLSGIISIRRILLLPVIPEE